MRRAIGIGVAALTFSVSVAGVGGAARTETATLAGVTQVSFGCPGPVRKGGPSCNPWHPLALARFSVADDTGRIRTVRSDARARFDLRLPAGTYVVKPLAQPELHTLGGPQLTVRIRGGMTTRILVRFEGFPQMA